MNKKDLISIIMPAKNAGIYIDECLKSIVIQSYANWELIAINDHSEDSTFQQLLKWSSLDRRIKLFDNEGQGIIPALNQAINLSRGKYISRMDADDMMHPLKLESLITSLKNTNRAKKIAVGKVSYFSDEVLGEGYKSYANWLNSLIDKSTHWKEIYKECVIPSPCWMMEKEDLIRIGGFSAAIYPEDYDMCFRLYINNYNVCGVAKKIHFWRDHKNRSSRNLEVYKSPWFLNIKMKYLIQHELSGETEVLVWGAGKKGKKVVKSLLAHHKRVIWITNNKLKWGTNVYGVQLLAESTFKNYLQLKIIIAVGNNNDKLGISNTLHNAGLIQGENFYMLS